MGSAELTQWQAFYAVDPWGSWRDNYHAGLIATTVANYSGHAKKAVTVQSFMYEHPAAKQARTVGEAMALMDGMATHGKK